MVEKRGSIRFIRGCALFQMCAEPDSLRTHYKQVDDQGNHQIYLLGAFSSDEIKQVNARCGALRVTRSLIPAPMKR